MIAGIVVIGPVYARADGRRGPDHSAGRLAPAEAVVYAVGNLRRPVERRTRGGGDAGEAPVRGAPDARGHGARRTDRRLAYQAVLPGRGVLDDRVRAARPGDVRSRARRRPTTRTTPPTPRATRARRTTSSTLRAGASSASIPRPRRRRTARCSSGCATGSARRPSPAWQPSGMTAARRAPRRRFAPQVRCATSGTFWPPTTPTWCSPLTSGSIRRYTVRDGINAFVVGTGGLASGDVTSDLAGTGRDRGDGRTPTERSSWTSVRERRFLVPRRRGPDASTRDGSTATVERRAPSGRPATPAGLTAQPGAGRRRAELASGRRRDAGGRVRRAAR